MLIDVKNVCAHGIKVLAVKLGFYVVENHFRFQHAGNGQAEKVTLTVKYEAGAKTWLCDILIFYKCRILWIIGIQIIVVALKAYESGLKAERQILLIQVQSVCVRAVHFGVAVDSGDIFQYNKANAHFVVEQRCMGVYIVCGWTSIKTSPLLAVSYTCIQIVVQSGIRGIDEQRIVEILRI